MTTRMTREQELAVIDRIIAAGRTHLTYRCEEPDCDFEGLGPAHIEHALEAKHLGRWSAYWDQPEQAIGRMEPK